MAVHVDVELSDAGSAAYVSAVLYVILNITAFCFDINLLMIDMMNDFAVKHSVNIQN